MEKHELEDQDRPIWIGFWNFLGDQHIDRRSASILFQIKY